MSNIQLITKIPNIFYFVSKMISEDQSSSEELAKKIVDSFKLEMEKKDAFPIDVSYRQQFWREFYERGVMMNLLIFVILTMIFGYAITGGIVSFVYNRLKRVAFFLKTVLIDEDSDEESYGRLYE